MRIARHGLYSLPVFKSEALRTLRREEMVAELGDEIAATFVGEIRSGLTSPPGSRASRRSVSSSLSRGVTLWRRCAKSSARWSRALR
jgi:hypothetical protein